MASVAATPAIHFLRKHGVAFTEHPYRYEEHGGTRVSSRELGVDEHAVVKTLVMHDEAKLPLLVLMHGDREVSTKQLARQIDRKTVEPCDPAVAQRHTGYAVGGTSPFGTRKPLPVYVERSVLQLERIYLHGGRRGLLVSLEPGELVRVLRAVPVEAAL
jgi:Cys-tRNA(Pro) deacylase